MIHDQLWSLFINYRIIKLLINHIGLNKTSGHHLPEAMSLGGERNLPGSLTIIV